MRACAYLCMLVHAGAYANHKLCIGTKVQATQKWLVDHHIVLVLGMYWYSVALSLPTNF